jgi:hypothetical protein
LRRSCWTTDAVHILPALFSDETLLDKKLFVLLP